jgi:hypothetical protein
MELSKSFKSRLVARGDQLHQFDPNNYAATVKSETLRILLAIVAERDFDYDSLDVKIYFLYPSLHPDDQVWVKRPYGLTDFIKFFMVYLKLLNISKSSFLQNY